MARALSQPCIFIIFILALISPPSLLAQDKPKPAPKPAPVLAQKSVRGDMPVLVRAVGVVEASETVEIKTRINGLVQTVHFTEGQDVCQGDLLFTIDSRDLAAELRTAAANLGRFKAQLTKAEDDKRRYDHLLTQGLVSRDRQEVTTTSLATLKAEISAAEAAVEAARVALSHAEIRSPISGRTGALQMDAGNMVKANADTPMVVITAVDPVHIRFSVPETHLAAIMASRAPLTITASPSGRAERIKGHVSFIDSSVDASTGTIALKAVFPNTDRVLWPGQFTDVILTVSTLSDVILIPEQAVTTGAEGSAVYVIIPGNTVEYRRVSTGPRLDGRIAIMSGLDEGELVVTDGHLRLSPGASVIIRQPETGAGVTSPKVDPTTNAGPTS